MAEKGSEKGGNSNNYVQGGRPYFHSLENEMQSVCDEQQSILPMTKLMPKTHKQKMDMVGPSEKARCANLSSSPYFPPIYGPVCRVSHSNLIEGFEW